MDVLAYIQYRPWANAWVDAAAISAIDTDRQYARKVYLKERNHLESLEEAYYSRSGEFLRSPADWDYCYPEDDDLSERKHRLIQSIVRPIREDARYTLGRAKDLLEEVRRITTEEDFTLRTRNFEIHRDFLLRTKIAIDHGLSAENDKVKYTRYAILDILAPVLDEEMQIYQDLLKALEIIEGSIDTH